MSPIGPMGFHWILWVPRVPWHPVGCHGANGVHGTHRSLSSTVLALGKSELLTQVVPPLPPKHPKTPCGAAGEPSHTPAEPPGTPAEPPETPAYPPEPPKIDISSKYRICYFLEIWKSTWRAISPRIAYISENLSCPKGPYGP